MPISPEYLAGFFDGEGCINITISGKIRQAKLRLMLVNTDYEFLHEIQNQYGGSLRRRLNKNKPEWKPFCLIQWTDKDADKLLKALIPHLRLKKKQAILALEFREFMSLPKLDRCDMIIRPDKGFRNRVVLTRRPKTIAIEMEFKTKMHELNRRGIKHVVS